MGRLTARLFAADGARVVLTDLLTEAGRQVAAEIGGLFIEHDVSDESAWSRVILAPHQRRGVGRLRHLVVRSDDQHHQSVRT